MTIRYELPLATTGTSAHAAYVWNAKRIVQVVAFAATLLATLATVFIPAYANLSGTAWGSQVAGAGVLQVGPAVLGFLVIPVIAAAVPLFTRGHKWQPASIASVILLAAFAAVSITSVGLYFVPAIIAAAVAAGLAPRS